VIDIVAIINAFDPAPDEQLSEARDDRVHHRDLSGQEESDLVRELAWLRTRNYLAQSEWHLQREGQVSSELRRRRDLRNERHPSRRGAA